MLECLTYDPTKKWAVEACRFLSAAYSLSKTTDDLEYVLFNSPILHLTAHGIKLILKHSLLTSGIDEVCLMNAFGHDIQKLWQYQNNMLLRIAAMKCATLSWREAEASGKWKQDFTENPEELLEDNINTISTLHTRESKFALRYPRPDDVMAPLPHLLIGTFLKITQLCLLNTKPFIPCSSSPSENSAM